jgi:hypothetical protein
VYFFPYVPRHWTEYRCPNGHLVARELAGVTRLGDPERTCKTCGLPVHVDAYREWPEMDARQRRGVRIGTAFAVVFAGGAIGVLAGAVAAVVALLLDAPDDVTVGMLVAGMALGFAVPGLHTLWQVRASRMRVARRARSDPAP